MRDPELVSRAQRAAARLEWAWERWRTRNGFGGALSQPVASYVGYAPEDPRGRPRVVFGVDALEAEQLALLLDGDARRGPATGSVTESVTEPAGDPGREPRRGSDGQYGGEPGSRLAQADSGTPASSVTYQAPCGIGPEPSACPPDLGETAANAQRGEPGVGDQWQDPTRGPATTVTPAAASMPVIAAGLSTHAAPAAAAPPGSAMCGGFSGIAAAEAANATGVLGGRPSATPGPAAPRPAAAAPTPVVPAPPATTVVPAAELAGWATSELPGHASAGLAAWSRPDEQREADATTGPQPPPPPRNPADAEPAKHR